MSYWFDRNSSTTANHALPPLTTPLKSMVPDRLVWFSLVGCEGEGFSFSHRGHSVLPWVRDIQNVAKAVCRPNPLSRCKFFILPEELDLHCDKLCGGSNSIKNHVGGGPCLGRGAEISHEYEMGEKGRQTPFASCQVLTFNVPLD